MKVLVIDVGGSNVKVWLSGCTEGRQFESNEDMTAAEMFEQTLKIAADWEFDVVSLGLPCRMIAGRPVEDPVKLGKGWVDFDYTAFNRPVRIVNDADLQALGSYRDGRMLFVGLGTCVGSTLISENIVVSLDVGRLLHADGEPICQLLGKSGLKRLGKRKWRQSVRDVLPDLKAALLADDIVIGGGQAELLKRLPKGVRRGDNSDALEGGIRLWRDQSNGHAAKPAWRFV